MTTMNSDIKALWRSIRLSNGFLYLQSGRVMIDRDGFFGLDTPRLNNLRHTQLVDTSGFSKGYHRQSLARIRELRTC